MKKLLLNFLCITCITSVATAQVSMAPNNGNRGQSLPIIISGQSTNWSGQGTSSLYLVQGSYTVTSINNISVVNANTISADLSIPANAPLGSYDLFLYSGTSTFQQQAFMVNQGNPSVMSHNPTGAQPDDTVSINVSVDGAGFKTSGQGIHSGWLSRNSEIISFTNIAVHSADSFSADIIIPATAAEGLWDINVYSNMDVMYYRSEAFEIDQSFSIVESPLGFGLELYPNPGTEKLNLKFHKDLGQKVDFELFTLSGKAVKKSFVQANPLSGEAEIDVSNLTKGVYFIQMKINGEVVETQKWVRQ